MRGASAYATRVARLKSRLEREGLAGAIVVPGPNMRYFTGGNSMLLERPFMLLIPVDGAPHLVAPTLESGPYRDAGLHMEVHMWTDSEGPEDAIVDASKGAGARGTWGVEGRAPFLFLHSLMKHASPKLIDAEPILQGLREVKDDEEVKLLRKSARILSAAFDEFPGILKAGATELEVADAATDLIVSKGASRVDDMLVQSGPRAADPHAFPSRRKIERGEGIVIDIGSVFDGYYADMTRTYCLGRSAEVERVYGTVLEAETRGIEASAAGVTVGAVDAAARGVLKRAGLGKHFFHRTGHGLGLEVHEAPYIVEGGKERLGTNMCFTVEPGVYIRGKLGVRIEDDVIIDGKRGVAITDTPKEFGWWN